jgi:hypothetical protein
MDQDLYCNKCVSEHCVIYTEFIFFLCFLINLFTEMHVIILNVYGLVMKLSQAFRRCICIFILKILLLDVIVRCLRSGDAVLAGVLWKSDQPSLHQGVQVGSSKS